MSWLSNATGVDINLSPGKGDDSGRDKMKADRAKKAAGVVSEDNPYGLSGDQQAAEKGLKYGEDRGETITGGTMEQAGQGRASIRSRLEEVFQGNSAATNRLKQGQNAAAKDLRAKQAVQGGGTPMAAGQQQALARQQQGDLAGFAANEQRTALSDLSREYRGMGGDIMKASGQYASIMEGSQPPANISAPQSSGGISVVCTAFYRRGLINDEEYTKANKFGRGVKDLDKFGGTKLYEAYFYYFSRIVKLMDSNEIANKIGVFLCKPAIMYIVGNPTIIGGLQYKLVSKALKFIYSIKNISKGIIYDEVR